MTTGRIFQLSRSDGGVPKCAVREADVGELGMIGDRQEHTKIHGGAERALCLFSLEVVLALQAEGHPIYPGSTGENVTISGLRWNTLSPGTQLLLGDEVFVELTRTAAPCSQIAASFLAGDYKRLEAPGEMRWYCRVLRGGHLRVAQPVRIIGSDDRDRRTA
jgi:MOSC domain-containing protein YiiM